MTFSRYPLGWRCSDLSTMSAIPDANSMLRTDLPVTGGAEYIVGSWIDRCFFLLFRSIEAFLSTRVFGDVLHGSSVPTRGVAWKLARMPHEFRCTSQSST